MQAVFRAPDTNRQPLGDTADPNRHLHRYRHNTAVREGRPAPETNRTIRSIDLLFIALRDPHGVDQLLKQAQRGRIHALDTQHRSLQPQ